MASKRNRSLDQIFSYLESHIDTYVSDLSDVVAIKSVSSSIEDRPATRSILEDYATAQLESLGATVDLRELGPQPGTDPPVDLPPVILATLGTDSSKKTILVYGHLDVQPAEMSDGWDTEPFVMTEIDGKMFGRGTTDDKGPILAWFKAIAAYQALGVEIPVNIKFIFEGMEESGFTEPLEELILSEKDGFFAGIDYTCISDNYWLGQNTPCITYGLRGIVYFHVNIVCAGSDLHSGVHGGAVYEGMTELFHMFSSMVTPKGDILIPGVNDDVLPLTEEEEATYENIDFDLNTYKQELGVTKLAHLTKAKVLQHRWRYPSLSIHGIEGAFSDPGDKTVIPYNIIGKFSIRLVPNMNPQKTVAQVKAHIHSVHASTGSENQVSVLATTAAGSWLGDVTDANYTAGEQATLTVHGKNPDLTREGGSIPIVLTLQEATGASVMLLPIGSSDDGAHSQNEKLNRANYLNGMKLLASYLDEVSKLALAKGKKL